MTLLNTMKPLNVFIVPKIYHIKAVTLCLVADLSFTRMSRNCFCIEMFTFICLCRRKLVLYSYCLVCFLNTL